MPRRLATPVILAGALVGNRVPAEPFRNPQRLLLWPGAAPGSESVKLQEITLERSPDPSRPDRVVWGISQPSLFPYLPGKPNGVSLIVVPGGGYQRQSIDKEGSDIAAFFVAHGVTVFVLKYRLPSEGHQPAAQVPLQDAQRAVRLVRARAATWGLDPARILVMGFSAGGHLASTLATQFDRTVYPFQDRSDSLSARPDGLILLYPVISMEAEVTHEGSRLALIGNRPSKKEITTYSTDRQVRKDSPPTFMVLTDDDTSVSPENSIRYYQALRRVGVPAELHIYSQGKHGFGIRNTVGLPVADWPNVALRWMAMRGLLKARMD